ncbi:hypothetical protein, partial [Enterococcus avium]
QQQSLLDSLESYTEEFGKIETGIENNYSFSNLKKRYLDKSVGVYSTYRCWTIVLMSVLIVLFVLLFLSNRFVKFSIPKDIIKIIIGY